MYASAFLKAHYPAAFYTALLNNQPMGFYHPATLVKDAQRHGVRFAPIDVQESDWTCRVDPDGRVRLGLMYVNGLRQEIGKAIAAAPSGSAPHDLDAGSAACRLTAVRSAAATIDRCSKRRRRTGTSATSARTNGIPHPCIPIPHPESRHPESRSRPDAGDGRYASIDDLVARVRLRRDELATLAEIGALNAFGHDRRSALWQIERAVRPAGELFEDAGDLERSQIARLAGPASARSAARAAAAPSRGSDARIRRPRLR